MNEPKAATQKDVRTALKRRICRFRWQSNLQQFERGINPRTVKQVVYIREDLQHLGVRNTPF